MRERHEDKCLHIHHRLLGGGRLAPIVVFSPSLLIGDNVQLVFAMWEYVCVEWWCTNSLIHLQSKERELAIYMKLSQKDLPCFPLPTLKYQVISS